MADENSTYPMLLTIKRIAFVEIKAKDYMDAIRQAENLLSKGLRIRGTRETSWFEHGPEMREVWARASAHNAYKKVNVGSIIANLKKDRRNARERLACLKKEGEHLDKEYANRCGEAMQRSYRESRENIDAELADAYVELTDIIRQIRRARRFLKRKKR